MRTFLAAAIGLACVAGAHAQGVVLHARLATNDTLRYALKSNLSLARGDATDPDRLEQDIHLRLTVADIDRDGNASVRLAFESMSVKQHAGGQDATYDPVGHPAEGGDSALAKVYSELATSILEMRVSPEGRIDQITGLEAALRAAQAAKVDAPERVLGPLSPDAIPATLGPIFGLDASGTPRAVGQSWVATRSVPLANAHTASIDASYTLKSLNDGIAEAAGPITVSVRSHNQPDAAPSLAIAEQSGSMTARWDTKAARLLSRVADQRLVWKASLPLKEPLVSSRTTVSRVELKALD